MIQGDWWIFPDGRAAEMGAAEHAVLARREMMKLTPSDYMATWNIMKSLDDDELRLARSRGADEEALSFLMRPGPDPRWYAMKNWGWIRVHTNTRKAETYFQTLVFDEDSLDVIRNSEFWKKQSRGSATDWVIVEELSTKKLFPMTAGKLTQGYPPEVLGREGEGRVATPSYRAVQQMYPSKENPMKNFKLPTGPVTLQTDGGREFVMFNPCGECALISGGEELAENPVSTRHAVTWAARLILGLGIQSEDQGLSPAQREKVMRKRQKEAELIVLEVRREQTGKAGSTIIVGRGTYTHSDGTIVDELSMQILIINFGLDQAHFMAQMEELADILRERFEQETVLVEIIRNGVTKETWEVTA